MEIKFAITPSERLALYQFRYSVVVEEMGIASPSADHADKLIRDADDEAGHIFSAFVNGQLAGTARINFMRDGAVTPHSDLLQLSKLPSRDATSVCSRFLVAKEQRGSLLAIRIVQAVYRFMRQSDIEYDVILVKPDLADFYERIGYRPYGRAVTHPEIGDVLPLRLTTLDEHHLRSIRSPLVQCLGSLSRKETSGAPNGRCVEMSAQLLAQEPAFGFLPAECIISDRSIVSRYENNVTAFTREIPLVLRPASVEQVAEIVREANRVCVPLYPTSTGKNWGLGSRLPCSNDNVVLDLSRLDRILEVNESLRYVVLEPGVTQGQLARYLAVHHPSLTFNLTGAFGETGVLGNTLERGDGMHARIDDLIGLAGILGNGEPFDVGGNHPENGCRFSRYAAGPDLVGLFTQSNFGVVTRMTFRLMAKNEHIQLLWGVVQNERLGELFDRLQRLFADRVIEPAMTNVGYANRFEQARPTLDGLNGARVDDSSWVFYAIVNRTPRISKAIIEESQEALSSSCEKVGHYINGCNSEGLPSFLRPLLQPLSGCPDYDSIKLVYGLTGCTMPSDANEVDLDQTPFGMKSYVAIVPPIAKDVTRAAEIIAALKRRLRSNIKISFFGDGRALVTIHFLKTDSNQVRVAEEGEAEIWTQMNSAGYGPYRVNIGQMGKLFVLRPHFFDLVSRLKSVLDPNGVLSPGHYCPE